MRNCRERGLESMLFRKSPLRLTKVKQLRFGSTTKLAGGNLLKQHKGNSSGLLPLVFTSLAVKVGLACLLAQCLLYACFRSGMLKAGPWSATPSYMAHQVIVLPVMAYLVYRGTADWFSNSDPNTTAEERLVLGHEFCDVVIGMLLFWDIPISFLTPKLRNWPMMIHHIAMAVTAALTLGLWSDGTRLFGYYAPFFFGLTEISTLPLVIRQLFEAHPDFLSSGCSSWLQTIYGLTGPLFALLFLAVRVIYFPFVSATHVLPDIMSVAAKGIHPKALYAMGLLNVLFTILQFYWGLLVIQELIKLL